MTIRRRAALLCSVTAAMLLLPGPARAADITLLCSSGLQPVIVALAPGFEAATGHRLRATFDTSANLRKQVDAGQPFDVVVLTPALIADLAKLGRVAEPSSRTLARAGVGLAVRQGAPKPDISTPDSLKATLLAAPSVVYSTSGASGGVFLAALEKLGITADMRPKLRTIPNGFTAERVVQGEAEIGVQLMSELLAVPGVDLAGPLPPQVQSYVVLTAAIATAAQDQAAAQALLDYVATPESAAVIRAKGMDPN